MFGQTFGHGSIKKYVIYFGTLFNNISINRYDNAGNVAQNFKVPLNYGPREKYLARAQGNPDGQRPIAMQLPRMSFEFVSITYDPSRRLSPLSKIAIPDPEFPGNKLYQYSPAPFDIEFQLSIMTKSAEDGTYIIEQILPYFLPEFTATLNLNPDLGLKYDIPLNLHSVTSEDSYEGDFMTRRAIIWTLSFTMKAWLFGPTRGGSGGPDGRIIQEVDVNIRIPNNNVTSDEATPLDSALVVTEVVTPGQSPDGEAVTWYGDATAATRPETVDHFTVNEADPWGFVTDFTETL